MLYFSSVNVKVICDIYINFIKIFHPQTKLWLCHFKRVQEIDTVLNLIIIKKHDMLMLVTSIQKPCSKCPMSSTARKITGWQRLIDPISGLWRLTSAAEGSTYTPFFSSISVGRLWRVALVHLEHRSQYVIIQWIKSDEFGEHSSFQMNSIQLVLFAFSV